MASWVKIVDEHTYLNVNTGARICASCELDNFSWKWMPMIHHVMAGEKHLLWIGEGIKEPLYCWYGTTETQIEAQEVAFAFLPVFMKSIENVVQNG